MIVDLEEEILEVIKDNSVESFPERITQQTVELARSSGKLILLDLGRRVRQAPQLQQSESLLVTLGLLESTVPRLDQK